MAVSAEHDATLGATCGCCGLILWCGLILCMWAVHAQPVGQLGLGRRVERRTVCCSCLCVQIFDYRRKYLPSNDVKRHTPPRLPASVVRSIRKSAEEAFKTLGMRDYGRVDGFVVLGSSPEVRLRYLHCRRKKSGRVAVSFLS